MKNRRRPHHLFAWIVTLLPLGVGLVGSALGSAACSSSGTSSPTSNDFPAEPYATAVGDQSVLRFELRTLGEPSRGYNTFELTVLDNAPDNGLAAPRDDLAIDVTTWMPAMGHGSSTMPTIVSEGSGRYKVSNLTLYMPGTWELRANASGGVTDRVVFSVSIP